MSLKYGKYTLGHVEAVFNKLGGESVIDRLLSGEVKVYIMEAAKKAASKILEPIGTVTVTVVGEFIASEHFFVNSSALSGVRVCYIGDNFRPRFLGKVEKSVGKMELRCQRLCKTSSDRPILKELGNLAETTLSVIWELLKLQPQGESGILLNNGYANIFYVRDNKDVLRVVDVDWSVSCGWYVEAYPVDDPSSPGRWLGGYQIFSRNS